MKNIDIPLPRLLDDSGAETGRITPARVSVSLSLTPLSTATMELLPGQAIKPRQWAELFTVNGSAGIYRANVVETGYGDQRGNAQFDHGAAEIGDYIVTVELDTTAAAPQAFATVFSYYRGTLWQLGTVEASDTLTVNTSHENVLQAMLALMEQLPGYYLDFDQSSRPWVVSVKQKPAVVSAEGRLSRNVESAVITTDPTSQCTRLYMDGLPAPGYVEADNIATEKVLEQYLYGGGDDLTAAGKAQLAALAQRYIAQHKTPARSIQITGHDFSAITGEPLDRVAVGKLYRLVLEEYGETALDHVTAMQFPDVYETPFACTLTLAQEATTIDAALSRLMREVLGGGGSAYSRLSQEVKQEFKKFETFINQTDEYIQLLATEAEWDELAQEGHVTAYTQMMRTARYILDEAMLELPYEDWKPQYLAAHPEDAELDDEALYEKYRLWITANPYAIYNSEYSDATRTERIISKTGINSLGQNETLYSKYTQASDAITAEVTRATGEEASIKLTVAGLTSRVADNAGNISTLTQTANSFGTRLTSAEGNISAVTQTANKISLVVNTENDTINAASIVAAINNSGSTVQITADHIILDGQTVADSISSDEVFVDEIHVGDMSADSVTTGSLILDTGHGQIDVLDMEDRLEDVETTIDTAVVSIGPASASGGQITIPWTKADGTAGTPVNFNIADTQFYQDGVAAAYNQGLIDGGSEVPDVTLSALYADEDSTHAIAVGPTGRVLFVPMKYRLSTDESASWWDSRISVDASLAYAAGQNAVSITGPTWSQPATNAQATFSTNAPTPNTKQLGLYLTQAGLTVQLRSDSASGDIRAYTSVEAPRLYHTDVAPDGTESGPYEWTSTINGNQVPGYTIKIKAANSGWSGTERSIVIPAAVAATMQALYVDEDATHEIGIGPTGKMLFVPMKYRLSSDSEASWWSSRINVDASLAYEAGEASVALTDWSNANVSEATTSQIAYLGKRVASTTADVAVGVTLSNGKSYSRWITGLDISDAYNAGRNSYGKSVTLRYVGAVAGVYTWTTSTYVSGLTENSRYTVHFDV